MDPLDFLLRVMWGGFGLFAVTLAVLVALDAWRARRSGR